MGNKQNVVEIVLKRALNRLDMEYVDPKSHIDIPENAVNSQLLTQASNFVYWATIHAKIRSIQEVKKLELENYSEYVKKVLKAKLYDECRVALELNGDKITESKLENAIYANKKYIMAIDELKAIQEELSELNEELYICRALYDAMSMRKDLLITLSANLRNQYDPTV